MIFQLKKKNRIINKEIIGLVNFTSTKMLREATVNYIRTVTH